MKKGFFLLLVSFMSITGFAYDIEIDGIYYNIRKDAVVVTNNKIDGFSTSIPSYSGKVKIPEKINYKGEVYPVKAIGMYAFSGCADLTSVSIPNSVKTIDEWAFSGCSGLNSIEIPNSVTEIRYWAFYNCKNLISVSIPNSVTSIGECVFKDCISLTSVYITDLAAWCNITFGGDPFEFCPHNLYLNGEEIKDLEIPNTVKTIGFFSFHNCSGLTSVIIPNSVTNIDYGAFSGCSGLTSVIIPNSVTSIGYSAFSGCSSLTSLTIDSNSILSKDYISWEGDKSLAEYAFAECNALSSLTIGNSVKTIEKDTFKGFSSLTSVTIPNSVTSIGENAFGSNLTSVYITDLKAWCNIAFEYYINDDEGRTYSLSNDHLFLNGEEIKDLVIPSSITSIGSGAFFGCRGLTSVTIPNSVKTIGIDAFRKCSGLTSVSIGNSVKIIGDCAFYGCKSLNSVHINDITAWLNIAFGFEDAPGFDYELYNNVYSNPLYYAHHLYLDEKEITDLIIPEGVTRITSDAFFNCTGLTSVTIPNSMAYLDSRAFAYCSSLKSVILPNSLNDIGYGAFLNCSNLEKVFCYSEEVPSVQYNSFYGSNYRKATLYVPLVSLDAYKKTAPWSSFGTILPIEGYVYTLTYVVDGNTYIKYTLKEGDSITPEAVPSKEGYTFSGWSEIPSTMPASDVTITGTFIPNKYKLTYTVDGEEYKSSEVDYGTTIIPEAAPTKDGYTFSGWSEIPSIMPANDVTVTGTFTVNKYIITYVVDDQELIKVEVDYGSTIIPPKSQKDGYEIQWSAHPTTMPAYDLTIYGSYITTSIERLTEEENEKHAYTPDGRRVDTPHKGLNIIRMSDGTVKKVMVK